MPEIRPYKPTWLDRHFKKALRRLRKQDQEASRKRLADLLAALKECRHPVLDPALGRWRPTRYKGVAKIRGGAHLVEYRFPGTLRVIVCYFQANPVETILLVAATLKHDHERMQRLIKDHRQALGDVLR